jgi:hypothetical protein
MEINSELLQLGVLDKRLPVSQKMQVSISITRDEMVSLQNVFNLKLDIGAKFDSLLIQEMSQSFHKEIFKQMDSTEEFLDNEINLDRVVIYTNTFYKLGEIGGVSVYIDAYKKWNDKIIICGKKDSFNYNYEIDEPVASNINTTSFSGPKFISQLNHQIVLDKNNFINLHYVNEYNTKYVQINRDKKLDELL